MVMVAVHCLHCGFSQSLVKHEACLNLCSIATTLNERAVSCEPILFRVFQRYLQVLQAMLQVLLYHDGPEEPNKGVASAAQCYRRGEDGVSAYRRQYYTES